MSDRLKGKIAIVVGGGQTPGDTIGNGRASAILYAREGAKVMVVDYRLNSAEDTCQMIAKEGGEAIAFQADATKSDECKKMAETCVQHFGRIDILHNNVGIGDNDGGLNQVTEEAWDRILAVNMKSVIMPCKHVIPIMRGQRGGATQASCAETVRCRAARASASAFKKDSSSCQTRQGVRPHCWATLSMSCLSPKRRRTTPSASARWSSGIRRNASTMSSSCWLLVASPS